MKHVYNIKLLIKMNRDSQPKIVVRIEIILIALQENVIWAFQKKKKSYMGLQ